MSKTDLIQILSSFPEDKLEEIIFSSVRELFFSGDWGTSNAIVEYILKGNANENFKGKIADWGGFLAVRAKNIKMALARYNYLESLEVSDNLPCLKANALINLSDLLLPDNAALLFELWQKSVKPELPKTIQEKYAKTGILLCEQFFNINDSLHLKKTLTILKDNLNTQIDMKNFSS